MSVKRYEFADLKPKIQKGWPDLTRSALMLKIKRMEAELAILKSKVASIQYKSDE